MSGLRFPNWARRDPVERQLAALCRPVAAPDVSAAVLQRVNAQQPFLSRRGRAWRLGALAGLGLAMVASPSAGWRPAAGPPASSPGWPSTCTRLSFPFTSRRVNSQQLTCDMFVQVHLQGGF